MNVVRRGPRSLYQTECSYCDSLLEYDKLDLIEFDVYTGDWTEHSTETKTGLMCLVCGQRFWNEDTNKLRAIPKNKP